MIVLAIADTIFDKYKYVNLMLKVVHLSETFGRGFFFYDKKNRKQLFIVFIIYKMCNPTYTLGTRTPRPGGCVTLT